MSLFTRPQIIDFLLMLIFRMGAVAITLSLLPIAAGKQLIIDNNKQIASQLPDCQDQKWFTLHWHSFYESGYCRAAFSLA
jgi:hypothetical protein